MPRRRFAVALLDGRPVTTVGYGDLYPTTVQGRLIGVGLMFVGIGFLSLLTAAVASRFVKQERGDEHRGTDGDAPPDPG
jgi:voltage-gated potassium channel